MKKFILCLCVYTAFLCIPIEASSSVPNYKIYMDSKRSDSLQVKEDVLALFFEICSYVEEDSYTALLKENIQVFENIEDSQVSFKKNTLIITIGDGQGTYLKGSFEKENVCFEEVKPKSKIKEWLGI